MGVVAFRAVTLVPIGFRALGAGFKMGGRFKVEMRLDPADAARYEYRQYIKGTATVQQGTFTGAHTLANWRATGPLHNAQNDFAIPGGLQTSFTEDGQVASGHVHRFGHRSASAVNGADLTDRYRPSQASGHEYLAIDTYGLAGNSRPVGLRVHVKLMWQGRIIDTRAGNRTVRTLHWKVEKDDIIT
jgi:hypothetical protein